MGSIDLDLQGHFGLKPTDFRNFDGFYAITRQGFDRESPFSHRMCILGPLRSLLKMGSIDLDLQGHFGLKLTDFRNFDGFYAITRQGFDRESPFSHRMCILGPLRSLLKMGSIDLDLQGHFGLKLTDFRNFDGFYAITRQGFDRESPFSHRMCILGPLRSLLKMGSIDLDLQGHFGLKLTDFRNFDGFYAITRQGFDRESPFSHRMCILGSFRTLSKMGSIDLDLQGHFRQMFTLSYLRNGLID